MKNEELMQAGEKYVRQKMKPRGGNSPVIGDNGVIMADGDASKAAKTIVNMIQNDPYFGTAFAMIQSPEDIPRLAATPFDANDVESMKKRFVGFVAQCMVDDVKFGNEMAYTAVGIDKDNVYDWENGRSRSSAHSEFIKKLKTFCRSYRECLGANGMLHYTTLIWWQKNYDGLVDSQQIVLRPEQPLGSDADPAELAKRIEGNVIEYQEQEDENT